MDISHARLSKLRYADRFRPYQTDAINTCRRYRQEFQTAGSENDPIAAALVYHPTGTGKTAVIAGLAHASPEIGNVLILTTREAIRDQLTRELSGGIFLESNKFGLSERIKLPKLCFALTSAALLNRSAEEAFAETARHLPNHRLSAFARRNFERLAPRPNETLLTHLTAGNSVMVTTVQLLVWLHSDEEQPSRLYASLREHIDVVVFDEGHYEPAARYSEVVRDLDRPTVLMTATPFRNDLKAFNIRPRDVHIYRFHEAVRDNRVRDVEIVARRATRDPNEFCADVIDFCTSLWGPNISAWEQRVIIRCDDMGCITRLGEAFIERGFEGRVVGIHDRYVPNRPDGLPWQYRAVPNPSQTDAVVWIHQHKLIEGIDDHRFQVLAFFDPMSNVRAVVQQIGRVIRVKPGENPSRKGIVLDHFCGRIKTYWGMYRGYDSNATPEALTTVMSRFYLQKILGVLPTYDYIDKKFRRLLNFLDPDERNEIRAVIADEILLDRSVVLKQLPAATPLSDVVRSVEKALEADDYEFETFDLSEISPHTVLFLCARVENVDFLNTYYFAEPRLEARLLLALPEHALLAATSTNSATAEHGLPALLQVSPAQMERLLAPGESNRGRINSVSSKNTNLGGRVVRGRVITAASVADIPPILDEHGHVVSAVSGYNASTPRVVDYLDYQENSLTHSPAAPHGSLETDEEPALLRRYVGISTGRVTESGTQLRVKKFREWILSLATQMNASERYDQVFGRYAALAPQNTTPGPALNLLLDLTDLSGQYWHRRTGQEIVADDVCVDRTGPAFGTPTHPAARFLVTINDTKYPVTVTGNTTTNRFRFDSDQLDVDFVRSDGRTYSLSRTINDTQAFTVVPENREVIYVHGGLYAPGLKFGPDRFEPNMFPVGHCLYPSTQFKKKEKEKGVAADSSNNYDPDTLFGMIENWKGGFDTTTIGIARSWRNEGYDPEPVKFTPTLCICDDMVDESADFILGDTVSRRVALIHAKASSKWKPLSASAVQEVCAQAQKNTALFSTYSLRKPPNLTRWDGAHRFDGSIVDQRIRKSRHSSAEDIWSNELAPLLHNPLTSREIWIVLGHMVSAGTLLSNLRSDNPEPEALQLNQLLQSTISAAGSVGAKVRIFCAP